MEIPEVFQLRPAVVLAAALLQGPLQGSHLGGEGQPLAAGWLKFAGITVVAAPQIGRRCDLQPLLIREGPQIQLFASAFQLLGHSLQGGVHVAPEVGEQAEGLALLHSNRPLRRLHLSRRAAAAKQLIKQTIATALVQVGLGVGLHAPLQGIHRAALERLADLLLFSSGVIDAEENSRIADVPLGLFVLAFE